MEIKNYVTVYVSLTNSPFLFKDLKTFLKRLSRSRYLVPKNRKHKDPLIQANRKHTTREEGGGEE